MTAQRSAAVGVSKRERERERESERGAEVEDARKEAEEVERAAAREVRQRVDQR